MFPTADNSFNHYAFGAVGEWIWKVVGGISLDDNNPGYRNVIINPQPGGGITNASASVNTIRGPVITSWTNNTTSNIFSLNLTNPANITASVYFRSANPGGILESGSPATNTAGLVYYQVTNGTTLFQLGSGSYSFTITNIVLGH